VDPARGEGGAMKNGLPAGASLLVTSLAAALALGGCSSWGTPQRARHDVTVLADRVRVLEEKVAAHEAELARRRAAESVRPASTVPVPAEPPRRESAPEPPALPLPAPIETADLPPAVPPTRPEAPALPAGSSVESAYETALARYDAGDLVAAEAGFQALVAAHPESELADNALFWIGAARTKRGDAAGAEETFRLLVESYPAGNKVPDALFQLGLLRERSGDGEGARAAFETVIDRFPLSEAAERAAERLRNLSQLP